MYENEGFFGQYHSFERFYKKSYNLYYVKLDVFSELGFEGFQQFNGYAQLCLSRLFRCLKLASS
ncbi:hypothetical protein QE422_002474 [Chryseobacterium sp. SORGH_AS 447]|nr:hypothetical protein [Chryseobacterium sp. SORGH_AS_0447]